MTQGFKQSIAAASKRDAGALPLIKALAPLQTLIHIGAGTGQGALHQWHAWDVAAAGHLQQGNGQEARQFTRLAQDWGCSKKLISQILISGVHNSLGCAAAVSLPQAKRLGFVPQVKPLVEQIAAGPVYMGSDLVQIVLELAGEPVRSKRGLSTSMFERFKTWLIKQLTAPEKVAPHACSTGVAGHIEYEDRIVGRKPRL